VLVEGAEAQAGGLAEADLVDVDRADPDLGDQAVVLRNDVDKWSDGPHSARDAS